MSSLLRVTSSTVSGCHHTHLLAVATTLARHLNPARVLATASGDAAWKCSGEVLAESVTSLLYSSFLACQNCYSQTFTVIALEDVALFKSCFSFVHSAVKGQ